MPRLVSTLHLLPSPLYPPSLLTRTALMQVPVARIAAFGIPSRPLYIGANFVREEIRQCHDVQTFIRF
jgi:hypothetical protein